MAIRLTAGTDDDGRRLDRILRKALPDHPLSLIHRMLRRGEIRLDGKKAKPESRILCGQVIEAGNLNITATHTQKKYPVITAPLPEIITQGAGIVVFNKPAGLASQGPGSLDAIVKEGFRRTPEAQASLSFKPGPLHRLDRMTSGAIAFSKNLAGARLFTQMLQEGKIGKTYLAIVEGEIPVQEEKAESWLLWDNILIRDKNAKKTFAASTGGKHARTRIRPLACRKGYTLIEAKIETGRTHQIRSQAAANGHPLAGDVKYGGKPFAAGGYYRDTFFLHSWKLEFFIHEIEGLPKTVTAKPPEAFMSQIKSIFGQNFNCMRGVCTRRPKV